MQDTLDGMFDLEGTNISKNTLEESRVFYYETKDAANYQAVVDKTDYCTGVAEDLSSVGSKELNYHDCEVMVRIHRQSPDIASGLHVGKDDLDDMCAVTEAQAKLLHVVQRHKAGTSDLRLRGHVAGSRGAARE